MCLDVFLRCVCSIVSYVMTYEFCMMLASNISYGITVYLLDCYSEEEVLQQGHIDLSEGDRGSRRSVKKSFCLGLCVLGAVHCLLHIGDSSTRLSSW